MKNRVLRAGDIGRDVKLLQKHLGKLIIDGIFGIKTKTRVNEFQAKNVDALGLPLIVDGIVGPLTWYALARINELSEPNIMLDAVVEFAESQVGVLEDPPGSNRGPMVDQYIRSVGLDPNDNHPWCGAFTYWCFEQAAKKINVPNPCKRTARVLSHKPNILPKSAIADPSLLKPGCIFLIKTSGNTGHMGIITAQHGGILETIEGNTNRGGGREGIGVFRREGRNVWNINLGFIDYTKGVA